MRREKIDTFIDLSDRANKRQLLAFVGSLTGHYSVDIRPRRNSLTNAQRGFFHGTLVQAFFDFRQDQGESYTFDECKQIIKSMFLKATKIDKATGEVLYDFVRPTEDLDVAEYSVLIEKTLAFLGELGIEVPDADQYRKRNPVEIESEKDCPL